MKIKIPLSRIIGKDIDEDSLIVCEQEPDESFVPGNYLVLKPDLMVTAEVDEKLSKEYHQAMRGAIARLGKKVIEGNG